MTATVVTVTTGSIALDYSAYFDVFDGYFSRIATALETIASSTNTPVAKTLTAISSATTQLASIMEISSFAAATNILSGIGQVPATVNTSGISVVNPIASTTKWETIAAKTTTATIFATFSTTVGGSDTKSMHVTSITSGTIFPGMTVQWDYPTPVNASLMPTPNYVESQSAGTVGGVGTYTLRYPILYTLPQNVAGIGTFNSTTYIMSTASAIVNTMKAAKII